MWSSLIGQGKTIQALSEGSTIIYSSLHCIFEGLDESFHWSIGRGMIWGTLNVFDPIVVHDCGVSVALLPCSLVHQFMTCQPNKINSYPHRLIRQHWWNTSWCHRLPSGRRGEEHSGNTQHQVPALAEQSLIQNVRTEEGNRVRVWEIQKQNSYLIHESLEMCWWLIWVCCYLSVIALLRGRKVIVHGIHTQMNVWSRSWLQAVDSFQNQFWDCFIIRSSWQMLYCCIGTWNALCCNSWAGSRAFLYWFDNNIHSNLPSAAFLSYHRSAETQCWRQ